MGTTPKIQVIVKTVAASGTPELLAAATVEFSSIYIIAQKSASVANTGNVTLQFKDSGGTWTDFKVMQPGDEFAYAIEYGNDLFSGADFRIKVATNGDGVNCIIT